MIKSGVPISPDQIAEKKKQIMPEVIDIFNELIAQNFSGRSSIVMQKEAVAAICQTLNIEEDEVFDKHYLDVEEVFREAGWDVYYDKPAYNESYSASFKFNKK